MYSSFYSFYTLHVFLTQKQLLCDLSTFSFQDSKHRLCVWKISRGANCVIFRYQSWQSTDFHLNVKRRLDGFFSQLQTNSTFIPQHQRRQLVGKVSKLIRPFYHQSPYDKIYTKYCLTKNMNQPPNLSAPVAEMTFEVNGFTL